MGSMIGIPGIILILIVALLLFGPNKLPELGRAFGRTLQEFKKGTRDLVDNHDDEKNSDKDKHQQISNEPSKDQKDSKDQQDKKNLPE